MVSPASAKSNQRPPGESAAAKATDGFAEVALGALAALDEAALALEDCNLAPVDDPALGDLPAAMGAAAGSASWLASPGVGVAVQDQASSKRAQEAPDWALG